jgi:NitT/TauT family transport system substrate-binding protein
LQAFQPGNNMTSLLYAADEMSKFLIDVGLAKQKPNTTLLFDDRFVKAYAQNKEKQHSAKS